METPLLELTAAGLYCSEADVYLDPTTRVSRAIISHGHSDHARPGMLEYICSVESLPVLRQRLGADIAVSGRNYGERFVIRGVTFSFHPAGHAPGSSQIRVERRGEVWVFSGDYKIEDDGVSTPFEPVHCNTFISECTFGLPVFRWKEQSKVVKEIESWIEENCKRLKPSVLLAYSLGKAQRLLGNLPRDVAPVYLHPSIRSMCDAIGFSLQGFNLLQHPLKEGPMLVLAPPGSMSRAGGLRLPAESEFASVSGWNSIRRLRSRQGTDRGFTLSDHADFEGLTSAIRATGAERVLLTHGFTAPFGRYLNESGINATTLERI